MNSDTNKVARPPLVVWDVDGTIIEGSMESHFVRWLRENGHVSLAGIVRNAISIACQRQRCQWHLVKLAFLRSCAVDDVKTWIDQCWETEIVPSLYSGPVEATRRLRDAGIRQVLLTGGPRPLAERMATHLGLDDVIAAEPEVVESSYTGSLIAPHPIRQRKLVAAQRWLDRNGLDWSQTAAVADHYDDRFLLARVAIAVVANPNHRMSIYASKRGWPVLRASDDFSSLPELLAREQ